MFKSSLHHKREGGTDVANEYVIHSKRTNFSNSYFSFFNSSENTFSWMVTGYFFRNVATH